MSWFVFALVATLSWGLADMFYKKSSDTEDGFSHLKIAVCVGTVMGVCALVCLAFTESIGVREFLKGMLIYSPASLSYIISMVIGYAGMRYLEISVISPVQNASGALSCIAMAAYFFLTGKFSSISGEFSFFDISGTAVTALGVIMLAVVEKKEENKEITQTDKKYKSGALALIFPLLYCVFDTVGTAADGIILEKKDTAGLSEMTVLSLYGITFFVFGFFAWIYLFIRTKKVYNPFAKRERSKMTAALCEEFGQIFYVYAMAANPVIAAPMISSYCIVSVVLSRVFLGEKLTKAQYACVFTVMAGVVLLGFSE